MPQVVEFEGATHEFPDDFSQSEISNALSSLHPQPQAPNPEGFWGGLWRSVSGLLGGPRPTAGDWAKVAVTHMAAMRDQLQKAEDAHSKGYDVEAVGHLLGTALPAAAHAGETMGGTAAQYDKYGNIVKQGLKPDIAGGVGETIGLIAPMAPETEAAAITGIPRAAKAVAGAAKSPGVGKIAMGTGETAAGAATLLHGNLFGIYPLNRGISMIKSGLAQRTAAAAEAAAAPAKAAEAARVAELEQFAPGYSKLSPKDKAITEMAYQRLKNGPPPETPPAGPIPGFSQQFIPPEAPPAAPQALSAQPSATIPLGKGPQMTVAPGENPAEALFREAHASGTIPAEAKPGVPFGGKAAETEPYKTAARGKRAANAETLSNAFGDYGLSAADSHDMKLADWETVAARLGLELPKTPKAKMNLIGETIRQLEAKEAAKP